MKTKKVKKEGLEECSMFGFGYDPNENECILCEKEYPEDFVVCKEQTLGEKPEKEQKVKKEVKEKGLIDKPGVKKVKKTTSTSITAITEPIKSEKSKVTKTKEKKEKTVEEERVKEVEEKKINTAEVEIRKVYGKLMNAKGEIEDRVKQSFRDKTVKRVLEVVATLKKKPTSLVELRKIYGGSFIYFIIMAMERAKMVKRTKEGLFYI